MTMDKNTLAAPPMVAANGGCQSKESLTSSTYDFVKQPAVRRVTQMSEGPKKPVNRAQLKTFSKREPVDLEFSNIGYTADAWIWDDGLKRVRKQILHGVSGTFESGKLTAIMGPSGAGKSTLLNGLAAYITKGFSGTVKCNGEERDGSARFKKLVAYIPQDEELRLSLTVMENMMIAADLKLGYTVTPEHKVEQVMDLLEVLGLEKHCHTMAGRLSGGQRKRLAIALELLSNPPILFLDEPTTGLDSLSCSQCLELLQKLARDGRTVICTIHQPSALLFEMFDHLYVLADGKCIYDGTIPDLMPHLAKIGLHCPTFHNPADYLMEVAIGEHGDYQDQLVKLVETTKREAIDNKQEKEKEMKASQQTSASIEDIVNYTTPTPANSFMQFLLLSKRNLLTIKRSYTILLNRLLAHILIGLLFGYLYQNVGKNAETLLANFVYLYGSLMLVVYTGQMSVTISFPLEMKVLSREHFNRWYKLNPYLLSTLIIEIPFQIFCTWIYIAISYWLTDQLFDYRVGYFVIFFMLMTLCAQAWGYLIGATTPIAIAVFIGPVLACLFSVFGFCIRYSDTPDIFKWLYHVSYFRAGFHGAAYSIYGLPRAELECPPEQVYCHYADPMKFMRDMDVEYVNIYSNMTFIILVTFLLHCSTYFTIWYKLNKR